MIAESEIGLEVGPPRPARAVVALGRRAASSSCVGDAAWSAISNSSICRRARQLPQEIEHQPVERGGVLDLGPVAALGEDVHARIRHHPGESAARRRARRSGRPCPRSPAAWPSAWAVRRSRFSRGISPCFLPNSSTVSGIDAGLVALLEDLVGQERGVVDDGLQQVAQLLAARAGALVVARDHLDAFDRERREDRRHRRRCR